MGLSAVLLAGCAQLLSLEDGRDQGACQTDAQCVRGYSCVMGVCQDACPGGQDCDSGSGGAAGSAPMPVSAGESGGGSDVSCTPNASVCVGTRATTCNPEGDGYVGGFEQCSTKETCKAGACEEHECTPSARFCVGDAVRQCAVDGLASEEVEACGDAAYCDAMAAECKPGVCAPNLPGCNQNAIATCNDTGSGFTSAGQPCADTQSCDAGECKEQVCAPGKVSCDGQDVKACTDNGLASTLMDTCVDKTCIEAGGSASCEGECAPAQRRCHENRPQECASNGEFANDGGACSAHGVCDEGSFSCKCKAGYQGNGVSCVRKSCQGLAASCGPTSNDDCCATPQVTGGPFTMGASTTGTIATFALDKYEVTVGRFRKFVDAYTGAPAAGAGAHPLIANSGWQAAWNAQIAADKAALATAVKCDSTYQTWSTTGTNDALPMNCASWYEAFAFCAWDGGWLPTEAEWEYAAKGGMANLTYPWGNTPVPSGVKDATAAYANYAGLGDGSPAAMLAVGDILKVGSKPSGVGAYGHLDLAGSMWEWTLDLFAALPGTCTNCANLSTGTDRVFRGGGWVDGAANLMSTARNHYPSHHSNQVGFRCAMPQ